MVRIGRQGAKKPQRRVVSRQNARVGLEACLETASVHDALKMFGKKLVFE